MEHAKLNKLITFSLLSLLLFSPLLTNAAGLVPCGRTFDDPETLNIHEDRPCTICDLLVLAQNVLQFALKMAFLVIIGFIVYGGFRWIFSLGKEENLKAGQQIITNAIIGLIIILTAWLIVNTVFWVIKEMGGDDYTGTWFHIECSEFMAPFDILEDGTSGDENGEPEPETGTYKDCEFDLSAGTAACVTKTWSGIENKPDGNFCEEDSFCQKFIYKSCRVNMKTGEPFCKADVWYGSDPKPSNECDKDSECQSEWENADRLPVSNSNEMCFPTAVSKECEPGFKFNKAKCEAGENTHITKNEAISNGNGWKCEFKGNDKFTGSQINICYPPSGTLYIDCIVDTDYVSPEEQIEAKKKEIEEKYPDLDGEWKEYPIMCPEWDKNCDEAYGQAECGTQKTIKDGFCFAIEPTKLLNPPGEIYGNGWHCDFGKSDINDPSPEGKSFAYCISK